MATSAPQSVNGKIPARKPRAPRKAAAKSSTPKASKTKASAPKTEAPAEASMTPASAAATPAAATPAKATTTRKATAKRATAARRAPTRPAIGTGTMIGAAAAGLAAGLVANLGRKAAVQAPSVMAGDWMAALKAEHQAALKLLADLAKTSPKQPARRTMLLVQLKHALGKHAFTEENVIYPALREWGDKADADALNHEQGYHKQFLFELEQMEKGSDEFAGKVADFRADLEKHIREEEDQIFPKLHAAMTPEKNKALTAMANKEGFKLA